MSALFNVSIIKAILTIVVMVFINFDSGEVKQISGIIPAFTLNTVEVHSDSADADEEEEKREKSVRISISDKGIKIDSDGKDKFILDSDSKNKIKAMVKAGVESIPDSISLDVNYDGNTNSFDFTYSDEDRYSDVKKDDFVRIGGKIRIEDYQLVQGDVVSVAGGVKIDGKVRGDVVCVVGNIDLGPSAVVNGDVVCVIGNLSKDKKARVRGETVTIGSGIGGDGFSLPGVAFFPFGGGIFRVIVKVARFTVLFLLLLIVFYFIPERMKKSSSYVSGSFLKSLGVGVLIIFFGSIVILIAAIILAITIIGIPLSLLLFLSYLALLVVCYFVAALALGNIVAEKVQVARNSIYLRGLIGLFILELAGLLSSLMSMVPVFTFVRIPIGIIGKFIVFLALLVGVGAFVLSKGGALAEGSDDLIEE